MATGIFSRIRNGSKFLFDILLHDKIKVNLLQAIPFWLASLVTGLVAVGYAKLFNYSERVLQSAYQWHHWLIFLLAPTGFVCGWLIVRMFAVNAKGSGIPQVMAAIDLATPRMSHLIDRLLNLRIIVTKIFSSLVMVMGGAAIGREGPTIQIAGSVFHLVNRWTPKSWPKLSQQSFIMTGAAAGLAAAFNTPLGGIVFAVEELARIHIRFIRTPLFTAIIIAGLTAQAFMGPYLYLGYPDIHFLHSYIYFGVAATAIIGGLGGGVVSKLILKLMRWRNQVKSISKIILLLVISGLLMAGFAYLIDFSILGSGKSLMTRILFTENKHTGLETVLGRIIGPIISFSSGASGGVFAPALASGASIGGYIADLFNVSAPDANILILSGMVAFLTGITRSPFTSAILVLEMTDRHSVIFHLMLAAMISSIAALLIDKKSFYEHLKHQYIEDIRKENKPTEAVAAPGSNLTEIKKLASE